MKITSKKNYTLPINTAFAEFLQTRSNDTKKQILQAKGNLEESGEFEVNPERILTLSANGNKYVGEYKDDKKNGQGTYTSANGE